MLILLVTFEVTIQCTFKVSSKSPKGYRWCIHTNQKTVRVTMATVMVHCNYLQIAPYPLADILILNVRPSDYRNLQIVRHIKNTAQRQTVLTVWQNQINTKPLDFYPLKTHSAHFFFYIFRSDCLPKCIDLNMQNIKLKEKLFKSDNFWQTNSSHSHLKIQPNQKH